MATVKSKNKLDDELRGKILAYNNVFTKENQFVRPVLEDLAKFCRAHESTFHPDARAHAVLEGRREVWLRIQQYLNLTLDELYSVHRVKQINQGDQ